jgi:NADPH:quinone reductase-like Zn-dependent oxidoreductase
MKYRRVVVTRTGGPEVLQLVEAELPQPKPDEVRVRVLAAGVAFADLLMRQGMYPGQPKPPFTPGYDCVGEVDQVGAGVTSVQAGQRVMALTMVGGYAEALCLPAEELVPVPDGVDTAEAGALALNYVTAYQMLHRFARVKAGDRVLVHGAAGGVGSALLELGRLAGLHMYGTASPAKHSLVAALGATPIDYTRDDFVARVRQLTGNGVDAVFDAVGGTHFWHSHRALRRGGRLVAYGYLAAFRHGKRHLATFLGSFGLLALLRACSWWKHTQFYSVLDLKQQHPDWYREDLQALLHLLEHGQIHPVIGAKMPLAEAAGAQELLARTAATGKIMLTNSADISK